MKAYIDSSIVLRIVFGEKGALALPKDLEYLISSEILKTDCLRTIDRMRHTLRLSDDDIAHRSELLHKAMRAIRFVKLTDVILHSASQPFPLVIKTLDALHLATAIAWQQQEDSALIFFTHNEQLGKTAKCVGFEVRGL